MTDAFRVSDITFTAAQPAHRRAGLLGWIALTLDDRFRFDGITLRKTIGGRPTLSYPVRRDNAGGEHPYVRPLDNDTRLEIERQVFEALGLEDAQ